MVSFTSATLQYYISKLPQYPSMFLHLSFSVRKTKAFLLLEPAIYWKLWMPHNDYYVIIFYCLTILAKHHLQSKEGLKCTGNKNFFISGPQAVTSAKHSSFLLTEPSLWSFASFLGSHFVIVSTYTVRANVSGFISKCTLLRYAGTEHDSSQWVQPNKYSSAGTKEANSA